MVALPTTGRLRGVVTVLAAACVLLAVVPVSPALAADKYRAAEWWLSSLHLSQAWQVSQGKGVKIALIDSGVDATHPDLRDAVTGSVNLTGHAGFDGNPDPIDPNYRGHGTAMAVNMAGRGHGPGGSEGMVGSAPAASVLSIETNASDPVQLHKAFVWAVSHGAKVINMSFANPVPASDIDYAEAHDVVLVAATGNDGTEQLDNGANFGVVAVAGVDQDLQADPNSNYGLADDAGVAGPGVAVAAPDSPNMPTALPVSDGEYEIAPQGGTSDSAAIVSGIVALIRAKFPHMDAANVINRLIKTAYRPAGKGVYDEHHGFGVPNAYAALTAKVPSVCENPLGDERTYPGAQDDPDQPTPIPTVGPWQGVWQSILDHKDLSAYTPACTTDPPTSSAPSTATPSTATPSSTPPASSSSAPSTAVPSPSVSTSPVAAGGGAGSSSTPTGLIAGLSAVVVVILAAIIVYTTRRRPRRRLGKSLP